jgi:hypothetical protein
MIRARAEEVVQTVAIQKEANLVVEARTHRRKESPNFNKQLRQLY